MITNPSRVVPRGTNGGVSWVGFLVSFLGGCIVGLAYYIGILLGGQTMIQSQNCPQFYVIFLGGISGLLGSIFDSILGATTQFSGWDQERKCVVDKMGPDVIPICGKALLDNHTVNLIASMLTALCTPFIAMYVF